MINNAVATERRQAVRDVHQQNPAAIVRGVTLVDVTHDRVEISMQVTEDDANGVGIAHGGITYFLADTAAGYAANSLGLGRVVTSAAMVSYLSPGRLGEELRAVCVGPIAHSGRTCVFDTTVIRPDGSPVAVVQSTMLVLRDPEPTG